MATTRTVFVQNWEESERGWGVRPDGFTIHTSKKQRDAYVSWYNATFNNLSEAPDEYTRISGDPIEVEVSDDLFKKIEQVTAQKKEDGTPLNAVHGEGSSFSPMRSLKDSNIKFPTPAK